MTMTELDNEMNTLCKELDTCQDDRPARRKRFSPQQLQFATSPFPPDVNHIFSYYVLEVNQPVEEPCQEDCEEEQDEDKKEGHKEVRSRRPAKEGGVVLLLPLLLHLLLLLHRCHKSVYDFPPMFLPIQSHPSRSGFKTSMKCICLW